MNPRSAPNLPGGMLLALAGLLAVVMAFGVRAEVRVSVADTDPSGESVLGRDEPFFVRVRFASDEPVSIWVRPFRHGEPVLHVKTNASGRHAGTGYALGWFSLDDASEVDEVRIRVGGGNPYREWVAATVPVNVAGTGRPAPTRARAPWVDELQHAEDSARREAQRRQMSAPVTTGERLLMSGFMLATLALLVGGLAVPALAMRRWRGGWRIAAAVPAALMAFVVLRIVVGTTIDPTSHNLWPFEILVWGVVALLILALIALARRLTGSRV